MLKFFNKKTMIVYVVLLFAFAILGSALVGVNLHYRKEVANTSSGTNEISDKIVDALTGIIQSAVDKNGGNTSATEKTEEKKEPEVDPVYKALTQKRDASFAFMIISYCLVPVFASFAIVSSEYAKRAEEDAQYLAKKKRMAKAQKAAN